MKIELKKKRGKEKACSSHDGSRASRDTAPGAQPQPTDTDKEVTDFSHQGHKAEETRAAIRAEHLIARLKKIEPMCYMNKEKKKNPRDLVLMRKKNFQK